MPENRFVGEIARNYDKATTGISTPEILGPIVECLEQLAEGGPASEFAIGTGRVAIPLSARGIEVDGIELSADMLRELHAKPAAARAG